MPSFAMKVYDLQWFTTFGMSYDQAAESLVADGIDTVIASNQIDPLPQSGVDQTAYLSRFSDRLAAFRDQEWTAALKRHGVRVIQTSAVLFDPPALERFPGARPIDACGQPEPWTDWYIGICPTHPGYLAHKQSLLSQVVRDLAPDGLFLQFMRFPGFWEDWTWNPDYRFSERDRFCFCDRCLTQFLADRGSTAATGDRRTLVTDRVDEWNAWRCERIVSIVRTIRDDALATNPQSTVTLNTLPFPASDFDGSDVRRTVAAQDLSRLSEVVDTFELMTYLQILKRPIDWIDDAVASARNVAGDREVVCTLQVEPLYLDGMHKPKRRAPVIPERDLLTAGERALGAGADGLVFYHWTDFLIDEARGGAKRAVLRHLTGAAG